MKPLTYMCPDDYNTYEVFDEYVFGNSFLVAPVVSTGNTRKIYLPKGKWYEYKNPGNYLEGPVFVEKEVSLFDIPVYIKDNSIFVTGDIFRGNSRKWLDNNNNAE